MNPPQTDNGFWKGKTEATLNSLSEQLEQFKREITLRLDKIESNVLSCPIGIKHSKQIWALTICVGAMAFLLIISHPAEMKSLFSLVVR